MPVKKRRMRPLSGLIRREGHQETKKVQMLRYSDIQVVFREVPGEISLAIDITGCPLRCEGCHSPWLREDTGRPLTEETLLAIADANPGISCVALLGGDADPAEVARLLCAIKRERPALKTCWYSGRSLDEARRHVGPEAVDYLKVGPYVAAAGPLDSPTTNQRMYRVVKESFADGITVRYDDITPLFREHPAETI